MTNASEDRVIGSVLGLALGDAFGAPYEGGILERALWRLLGKRHGKRRWTDDTQMTIDLIESLIACGRVDQDDLARRFAASYRWSRGYGPGAGKILKRIRRGQPWQEANRSVFPDGSFGNGGAMRVAPVAIFFADAGEEKLVEAAHATAEVTHAHPLAAEGAVVVALAVAMALDDVASTEIIERLRGIAKSPEFLTKLQTAGEWLEQSEVVAPRTTAAELGNRISAVESCVTAVYAALAFRDRPFDDLLEFCICLGGDVDTIAAMAGAIWGAARGRDALPEERLGQIEQLDRLERLSRALADAAAK